MEGTNPFTMSEWLTNSSLPLAGNLDLENTKILFEVLKLHSSQWLRQHIIYLFICHNILDLHYSSLHHIPDIVIFDLDVLRLVMEHQVLLTTSHNFGCHNIYKYHLTVDQINQRVASSTILPHK